MRTYNIFAGGMIALLISVGATTVAAKTKVYTLVLGNNAPPPGSGLRALRYADDDAVRYYHFFKRFSERVYLFTVPDARTQSRYPDVSTVAMIPSLSNFDRVVNHVSEQIKQEKARGNTAVVYLAFSGHGAYSEQGEPYLSLADGGALTHKALFGALTTLGADFTHLFIDACYAEGVVWARGMFDNESDSRHVQVSETNMRNLIVEERTVGLPGLGVIMASSEYQKTHEWSHIESGIFTHEILSGLSGPADINLDGKIEYSEIVAFVSSANRDVSDPRGRIQIIARPPERNHNIPLIDLTEADDVAFLKGDLSSLGHFHIELESGERYLDANLAESKSTLVMLPGNQSAYLIKGDREATLRTSAGQVLDVAMLTFGKSRFQEKGSLENAFQKGLFNAQYCAAYYRGFIDSTGLKGVSFDAAPVQLVDKDAVTKSYRRKRALSIASFALGGGAAVAATVFGALSLKANDAFSRTHIESESIKINKRFRRYTAAFWPLAAAAPITLFTSWLLWPKANKKYKIDTALRAGPDDGAVLLTVGF